MNELKLDNFLKIKLVDGDADLDDIQESRSFIGPSHRRLGDAGETHCCAFSPDGKLLAWSIAHGFVKVCWFAPIANRNASEDSLLSNNSELTIDCAKKVVTLKFGPLRCDVNENVKYLLATGLDCGRIKLWNPFTGEMMYNLSDHHFDVKALSFALLGEPLLISCSLDKTLKVWDLADDGNMTLTITGHPLSVFDCAFSPVDPSLICSVGKGSCVIIWKLHNKRHCTKKSQLRGHHNDVVSCSWSPDGALVATASHDTTVIVWDPHISQQIMVLGHVNPLPEPIFAGGANGAWLSCVCFSPDGSQIATLCEDEKLRVWSLWTNEPTREKSLNKPGSVCIFSPNGSSIALGNSAGSVVILDIGLSVMPLRHLSRLALRTVYNTSELQILSLPSMIKRYLQYTARRF
ncbi:WD repeat and SOCS box-containing protein 1-like [Styela clava]